MSALHFFANVHLRVFLHSFAAALFQSSDTSISANLSLDANLPRCVRFLRDLDGYAPD